jgi:hypothetical protein
MKLIVGKPDTLFVPKTYKLLFANQSVDTKKRYTLVRETKTYVFLEEIAEEKSSFTLRVHKNTLSVKGIYKGKTGYQFDVPRAISMEEVK